MNIVFPEQLFAYGEAATGLTNQENDDDGPTGVDKYLTMICQVNKFGLQQSQVEYTRSSAEPDQQRKVERPLGNSPPYMASGSRRGSKSNLWCRPKLVKPRQQDKNYKHSSKKV